MREAEPTETKTGVPRLEDPGGLDHGARAGGAPGSHTTGPGRLCAALRYNTAQVMGSTTAGFLAPYHKRLLVFLGVAAFFEGYDYIALSQILPALAEDFGFDDAAAGWLGGAVNFGGMLAFLLVRLADRYGRRPLLGITIIGYTVFSFATGLTSSLWLFGLMQVVANMFLLAEYALSFVYAAEEFPAERRGMAIGMLQAVSALGSIACAVLVPILLKYELGWRLVYFTGTVPLVLLIFARRNLRETRRFQQGKASEGRFPLLRIFKQGQARNVILLAAVWTLTYANTKVSLYFWKKHARDALGFDEATLGGMIAIGAALSLPFLFAWPFVIDRLGRRGSAVVVMGGLCVSTLGLYMLTGYAELLFALFVAIFANSAVLAVLNALTSELFPTQLRADGYAWSNNLLGRIGSLAGPPVTGQLAMSLGGYSAAVAPSAFAPLLALVVILWWLPETAGRELDDIGAPAPSG